MRTTAQPPVVHASVIWRTLCRKENTSAHRTASHALRGEHLRVPFTVRHRAPRARLRLHARQLASPHPALVHPGRRCHEHPDRRHPARVRHDPRREGRRRRDRPQHQEPRRLERARRADHRLPAQAGCRSGHRRRHLGPGRCRDPQPRPRHRDAQRQGEVRARADHRARPRLRVGDPEPQRVQRGRPDPGRLDLLARAQGHLPRRGHACR